MLAVSQTVVDAVPDNAGSPDGAQVRNTEAKPDAQAITVTLLLTPEEAQKLLLAEANGEIRLTDRHYGDNEERQLGPGMTQPELFPRLPNPFLQR